MEFRTAVANAHGSRSLSLQINYQAGPRQECVTRRQEPSHPRKGNPPNSTLLENPLASLLLASLPKISSLWSASKQARLAELTVAWSQQRSCADATVDRRTTQRVAVLGRYQFPPPIVRKFAIASVIGWLATGMSL